MKAINEKEFKALIKLYESITLDQLKKEESSHDIDYKAVLTRITGFGSTQYCSLCRATRKNNRNNCKDCNVCVYGVVIQDEVNACIGGNNTETYNAIHDASSLEELLTAIQNRAKHMKNVWKQYLKIR